MFEAPTTQIWHHQKSRVVNVRNIEVKSYQTPDRDGIQHTQEYVQFEIVGENRVYEDFMLLEVFKECNPGIPLA